MIINLITIKGRMNRKVSLYGYMGITIIIIFTIEENTLRVMGDLIDQED